MFPKELQKGMKIGLVCPSSPLPKERADSCVKLIQDMGYKVKVGKSVYLNKNNYLAGEPEVRAKDINEMFGDETIDAIFCVRGGDGSYGVMDLLDFELIKKNPKVFVGYSDITNIHLGLNQVAKLVTYHGPMVSSNMLDNYDEYTQDSFERALHMSDEFIFENPKGEEIEVISKGKGEGILIGGNLTLLTHSLGSFYELDTDGKILFIEDVNANITIIDRMINQLKHCKKLDKLAGILVGDFANAQWEGNPEYTARDLMYDLLSDLNIPVLYNIKSGHCFPMGTVLLGARVSMDTENKSIKFYKD